MKVSKMNNFFINVLGLKPIKLLHISHCYVHSMALSLPIMLQQPKLTVYKLRSMVEELFLVTIINRNTLFVCRNITVTHTLSGFITLIFTGESEFWPSRAGLCEDFFLKTFVTFRLTSGVLLPNLLQNVILTVFLCPVRWSNVWQHWKGGLYKCKLAAHSV